MKDEKLIEYNNQKSSWQILNYIEKKIESNMEDEVIEGLSSSPKFLPSKYFYDEAGSRLFEEICRLPEYYPTRTEISILKDIAPELSVIMQGVDVVELGAGAHWKIEILLDSLSPSQRRKIRYIPLDISPTAVEDSCADLKSRFPELDVLGIVADFTQQLHVVPRDLPNYYFFLGSTIGNFAPDARVEFLRSIRENLDNEDRLFIGFDLIKNVQILEWAYNDSKGITAAFNKNILSVINQRLGSNIDPDSFEHRAFFNAETQCIEMHLVSSAEQTLIFSLPSGERRIPLQKGEGIHTENSCKFTQEKIFQLASEAELEIVRQFWDEKQWFSIVEFSRKG